MQCTLLESVYMDFILRDLKLNVHSTAKFTHAMITYTLFMFLQMFSI